MRLEGFDGKTELWTGLDAYNGKYPNTSNKIIFKINPTANYYE